MPNSDIFKKLNSMKREAENIKNSNIDGTSNSKINSTPNTTTNNKITITKEPNKELSQSVFYIRYDQDEFLNRLKKKTGRNRSEIIRIALDYLQENIEIK